MVATGKNGLARHSAIARRRGEGQRYTLISSHLKRVVAIAGDTFSIKNGISYLNNKPLNETYVLKKNNLGDLSQSFGPVTVPDGFVFVLGDNRDESADSRIFGLVPVGNITAKVLYVLYSTNLHKWLET